MTSLIILILVVFIYQNSFAQVNQQWLSTYNGSGTNADETHAVAVDLSGNVYVTGSSTGSGTGTDYATVKYNAAGVQQWAARYNGQGARNDFAKAIAVDGSGNTYVTGWSDLSATGKDYATIKYNSAGDSVWVKRYTGVATSFNDEALSIAVDGSGNCYVTGYSVNGTNSDYATIKYNSSGVQQWVARYDGPGAATDNAYSVVVDGSGNVYVTGLSVGAGTNGDYATIKYNSSGVQQWASRYNGPSGNTDAGTDIAIDVSGNVYVTGYSAGSGTGDDYATIKYNSAGIQQWLTRYNGPPGSSDAAFSLAVDASGNVLVTGASLGFGTSDDYATIKYNSLGAEQWVRRYNGPGGNVADRAYALAVDGAGNIYVTGESNGEGGDFFQYATIKYNTAGDSVWTKGYGASVTGHDRAYAIALDASGNVYVAGTSVSGITGDDYAVIKYTQNPYAVITSFIQGFYNASSDIMVNDTSKVLLRNTASPYTKVDSAKSILNSSGTGTFYFSNVLNAVNYYIVLKHRNSIETWSNVGFYFSAGILNYNFSTTAGKAYGSNQIQIDTSPIRFGIYSGDANQDGTADVTDVVKVFNDANNFVSGYLPTDMTGDNFTDASDLVITFNNSVNFVAAARP
ncbi:MAG: SBBP repeat-containing protein [bacterium]